MNSPLNPGLQCAPTPTAPFVNFVKRKRDHLFFGCRITKSIWEMTEEKVGMRYSARDWNSELGKAVAQWKGRSLYSTIGRLIWTNYIYWICIMRNKRIFHSCKSLPQHIVERLLFTVRNRLFSILKLGQKLTHSSFSQHSGLETN